LGVLVNTARDYKPSRDAGEPILLTLQPADGDTPYKVLLQQQKREQGWAKG
jgi:hypothetical protein